MRLLQKKTDCHISVHFCPHPWPSILLSSCVWTGLVASFQEAAVVMGSIFPKAKRSSNLSSMEVLRGAIRYQVPSQEIRCALPPAEKWSLSTLPSLRWTARKGNSVTHLLISLDSIFDHLPVSTLSATRWDQDRQRSPCTWCVFMFSAYHVFSSYSGIKFMDVRSDEEGYYINQSKKKSFRK